MTDNTSAGRDGWIATWTTALIRPSFVFENPGNRGFENVTLRECFFSSAGGEAARVRLSNRYGTQPLVIGRAAIGARGKPFNSDLVEAATRPLTFSGETAVTIPPGADVLSDPTPFSLAPHQSYAVDIFLPGPTGPVGYNFATMTTSFIAPGDCAGRAAGAPFQPSLSWYVLQDVEVEHNAASQLIVAFCDSVSLTGQLDANMRWPEIVSRLLRERFGEAAPSMIQSTLSGQRLVTSFKYADCILDRFERDILPKAGLKRIVVNVGVNDLGLGQMPDVDEYLPNRDVSAEEMIEGFRGIARLAHEAGLKIFGSTITPGSGFAHKGNPYWSPAQEMKRRKINDWIRANEVFDGVFDFARAVQNPLDEEYFAPWASSDNIHPNDGGQYAIARCIDLDRLCAA
jgi:lysophospholipase L1-like esterase